MLFRLEQPETSRDRAVSEAYWMELIFVRRMMYILISVYRLWSLLSAKFLRYRIALRALGVGLLSCLVLPVYLICLRRLRPIVA